MGTFDFYVVTTLMSVIGLVNILEVYSANNLVVNGNQVFGESIKLQCSTTSHGTKSFVNFYGSTNITQLGQRRGYSSFTPDQTPLCPEYTINSHYLVTCNSDGSMFTMTIPATNTPGPKMYWRCRTNTASYTFDNNVIAIFMTIPITGISMIGPPTASNNTVTVTTYQPVTFQCQTTRGRPAANVTWYLDNAPLSGGRTTTTPVSGDIVITTGSLTLTVLNRTADGKVLSCRATNYVNMEPVESTEKQVIRFKYAPSVPPIIVGYNNGTVYKTILGRPQSVTCEVPTSNPVPTLSWSCPSYTVTGTTPLPGSTDVISSSITWTATSTEPGQTCQCTAYQDMAGHVTTYFSIDILYPPTITGNDASVPEHSTVTLSCSAEGVPATYTFYNWTHVAPDNVTILRSLPGIHTSTTTTLTLSDVNYQDTGYYRCNVSNGIQDYITGTSSTSFDVTLTVRSKPIVTWRQQNPGQTLLGRNGDNIKLSVEFYSNSVSPPNMIWYRAGECPQRMISGSRFETFLTTSTVDLHMYGQTVQLPGFNTSLTVKNSQESDFTNYKCEVVNDIGTLSVDISLLQEGPPEEPLLVFAGASQGGGITVIWQIGIDRGHEQKVNIVFKLSDSTEWTQYTAISKDDTAYRHKNGFYFTTIDNLQPDVYTIGLYARNELGQSDTVNKTNIGIQGRLESSPDGSITGPVIGAVLGGIVIGVLVILGTQYLRSHWRDKGATDDKTQSSSENQLSTGDQGTPVYTNLELTVTPHLEREQQYQVLTPDRSASTSAYQTLDIADIGVSDLDSSAQDQH